MGDPKHVEPIRVPGGTMERSTGGATAGGAAAGKARATEQPAGKGPTRGAPTGGATPGEGPPTEQPAGTGPTRGAPTGGRPAGEGPPTEQPAGTGPTGAGLTVEQAGGRRKAFRPLPESERAAAYRDGLEAYRRGDFFEAHELLEPAWMGTDDLAERALYQGLIKLAAAYVHAVRGNPRGVAKNLDGALLHLRTARSDEVDVPALIGAIEARLAALPELLPAPELPERR